jgi:Fe-S-cluster containining protein
MKKHHDCFCKECIAACKSFPGVLMPGDIGRLARYLGISEQELFDEHLAVMDLGWTRVPVPATNKAPAGMIFVSEEDVRHRCHWLSKRGLCLVHEVKPTECAEAMPCSDLPEVHRRRILACEAWTRPQNRRRLEKLLGE